MRIDSITQHIYVRLHLTATDMTYSKIERTARYLTKDMPEETPLEQRYEAIPLHWTPNSVLWGDYNCEGCNTHIHHKYVIESTAAHPRGAGHIATIGGICLGLLDEDVPEVKSWFVAEKARVVNTQRFMAKQIPAAYRPDGLPFTTYAQMKHYDKQWGYSKLLKLIQGSWTEDEKDMYNAYYSKTPRRKTKRAPAHSSFSI